MATANRVDLLTDEQHRAIFHRETSIALSAGAGCGKTFVLTERFLSHLSPTSEDVRCGLGDLLAITFTDRAAREMRDRIREKCHQRLMAAGPNDASQWLEIYRQIDSARVGTIHAFCASLLRQYPVESNLDPHFTVLDEAATETLLSEAIDDQLRKNLAHRDPATFDLMVNYSLRELRSMIRELVTARHEIDFVEWSEKTADDILHAWSNYHHETSNDVALRTLTASVDVQRLKQVIETAEPGGPVMAERFATLQTTIAELGDSQRVAEHLETLHENARIQGGGPAKSWPDSEAREAFKETATKLRERIGKIEKGMQFDPQLARPIAESGLQLLAVCRGIVEAFEMKKHREAALDFDDLMIRTRDLLTSSRHPHVCRRVAAGVKHLLIDEFQDTNRLQVELVKALCGDQMNRGKLFIVGDFKQSIYRFRHAQPQIFRDLREQMPEGGRLSLTENFRSQPAILDFVNALFCEPMGEAYEPLRAHRPQVSPVPAVEFLWATPSDDDSHKNRQGKISVGQQRKVEADWIARRIRAMLDSGEPIIWDSESEEPSVRSPRMGDFVLLFRALSNVDVYESALREYGLDYYLVGGRAFYAQQEIFDLANLLRTLASEVDEVSLVGVLRSPFFSLSDDTLFWLAQHAEGLSAGLFDATYTLPVDDEQRRRKDRAAETLRALRARKDRLSITELIQESLRRTAYDAVLLAEFLGQRKLANLQKLIELARSFDASGMFTLNDFVVQLAEFIAKQPAEPIAATQPESTSVIRLMTIHQSKGLEFPVVIIPDLERSSRVDSDPAAFHSELGPLVKAPLGSKAQTGLDLYRRVEKLEGDDETTRLLYVATTRAADYLILSSGVKAADQAESPWRRLIQQRFDLQTGATHGDLPPGYATPEVTVTSSRPELADVRKSSRRGVNLDKVIAQVNAAAANPPQPPATVAVIEPHRAARLQFSFSRLSGALEASGASHEVTVSPRPSSSSDRSDLPPSSDPLLLGTLVHAALAQWPGLSREGHTAAAAPDHLVQLQADKLQIDDPLLIGDARDLVRGFVVGPRAESILAAKEVLTEIEFMLTWPPPTADQPKDETKAPSGEQAVRWIQGVIDCLYQSEDGAWHLLDYKTNQFANRSIEEVAEPYRMQMLLYALAIEHSLGVVPVEMCLHFLRGGQEHAFEFKGQSRDWLVEQVNQAIAVVVM